MLKPRDYSPETLDMLAGFGLMFMAFALAAFVVLAFGGAR